MYVVMYIDVRAVVRARPLCRENGAKSNYGNTLAALGAYNAAESRNLEFWARNLDFLARNLDVSNRNLDIRFNARKDLRKFVEVTRLFFYPYAHARVRVRARAGTDSGAMRSGWILTLRNLETSTWKEAT